MRPRRIVVAAATFAAIASVAWVWPTPGPVSPRTLPGWALYDRLCLPCHGADGDGLGPAAPYTASRPRDLAKGEFAWRTTRLGDPPTDDDLRFTIQRGAPGTSMPGFPLAPAQIDELVAVVKAFAPATFARTPTLVALGAAPPPDPARGAMLWKAKGCVACHGERGTPDAAFVASSPHPPYDLAREPLHRPHVRDAAAPPAPAPRTQPGAPAPNAGSKPGTPGAPTSGTGAPSPDAGSSTSNPGAPPGAPTAPAAGGAPTPTIDKRRAAALAIATGRPAMPAYAGALSDADLWALADHVLVLGARAREPANATALTAATIALDRKNRVAAATWPAAGDDAVVWGAPVPPQGPPSIASGAGTLAPAEASLAPQQCARCHLKQYREWETSRHHDAASPGLAAQRMGLSPAEAASCLLCHAPLPEQAADEQLQSRGLSCAGCHLRGWRRHGPPNVAPSLLSLPDYPLTTLPIYERADFCLPCHQLPSRSAVAGRPLLDTYREWLEGPYMPRGIQCQHCHMPNREHSFLGVHDAHTFRQGIALSARAHVNDGEITVVAELANVGAGHFLPTTPTPAAWLVIELVDARGRPIEGAKATMRIGRDIYFDGERWHERADTRIPPGAKRTMARAWTRGRTAAATHARVSVVVVPDDYYERLYEQRLAGKLAPARRALYEQALAKAKAAHYTATRRDIPIER